MTVQPTPAPTPGPTIPPSSGTSSFAQGIGGGQSGFPTAAPSVFVPFEFNRNRDQQVPGLTLNGGANSGNLNPNVTGGAVQNSSMSQALLNLLVLGQQDEQGLLSLQEQLIRAGYLNPSARTFNPGAVNSGDATYGAYAKLLNDAIVTGADYSQILDNKTNDPKNRLGQEFWQKYQQRFGGQPIEKQVSSTTTNLTSTPDARVVAQNEFQRLLGRDVNAKEAAAFHAALNAFEQANPTHTTRDVTIDPSLGVGGYQERNVVSSGGISQGGQGQLADQQIIQNNGPEYAQAQGDQVYDLFAQLIGSRF